MPYQVLLGFRECERLRGATGQEQRLSGNTSLRRLETEPRCARKTVTGLDGVRWHALLSSRMPLNGIAAALPSAIPTWDPFAGPRLRQSSFAKTYNMK